MQASRTRCGHFVAARLRQELGGHRRAARRQLIDDRHVEVRVVAHRERARNRRCAHHELVRLQVAAFAGSFRTQRQALLHAEAVLLVDDGEGEVAERDWSLEQRVGADGHLTGAGLHRASASRFSFLDRLPVSQATSTPSGRSQPENWAKCCSARISVGAITRHLPTGFDRLQRGERGDDRLAAAHVALQQSLHGMRPRQIGTNLGERTHLGAGEPKGQCRKQPLGQPLRRCECRRARSLPPRADAGAWRVAGRAARRT